jgi:DNA-binding MarR family transcriptional regulator
MASGNEWAPKSQVKDKFVTDDVERDSASGMATLKDLGAACIKLLKEAVEHGEIKRAKLPKAAATLEEAGLLRIRESEDFWSKEVTLSATLYGWEAVDELLDEEDCQKALRQKPAP